MGKSYVIADTHFGHKSSLNWPDAQRGKNFNDIEEMNETIINNWNSIVGSEDTVYHLGDFAYKCSKSFIRNLFNILNGKIILIKGNHDGKVLKVNQTEQKFESVHDYLEIEYNDVNFVLCHYPIWSWKNKRRGWIHLHGHTHEQETFEDENKKCVSVEKTEYKPVLLDVIIKEFTKK